MSATLKEFDVVKIIGVKEQNLIMEWWETPTDDVFREAMKDLFRYAGTTAMCVCVKDGGDLLPIIGHLPFNAWWRNPNDYILLGNIKDGYVVNKDEMQKEYNAIQKYISDCIDEADCFTFDQFHFAEHLREKYKS